MASDGTNDAVGVLRRQHAAELAALDAVKATQRTVQRHRDKRAAALVGLDAAVADAEQAHDEALAVLAALVPELAGDLAGVPAARVRQCVQRAPADRVRARVDELKSAPARRRGRPPGRAPATRGSAAGRSPTPRPVGPGAPVVEDGASSGR